MNIRLPFILLLGTLGHLLYAQSTLYRPGMSTKALWPIKESMHKQNQASGSYTYREFIYLANEAWPELDDPIVNALQAELPTGKEVLILSDGTSAEQARATHPQAHVFFFSLDLNAQGENASWALEFAMHDESGSCEAVRVNHLICHPPEVTAKILVKNVLELHQAMGDFLEAPHKDHYTDIQAAHVQDIRSLKEQTLFVAATDLNVEPEAVKNAYSGNVSTVAKEDLYEMILDGADAYVLLAPDDDCRDKVEDTKVTNVKVLYHCASGKCYVSRFPDIRKGGAGFGFSLADFKYLENPKL